MSIPHYNGIDNGMLIEEYEKPVTRCSRCHENIYEGDTLYRLESEIICASAECLEDWAKQYSDIAKKEDFIYD